MLYRRRQNAEEKTTMTTPTVHTAEEVAELLKVSVRTVYRAIEAGKIRAFRIGKSWRISQEALDAFIKGDHMTSKTYNGKVLALTLAGDSLGLVTAHLWSNRDSTGFGSWGGTIS